MTKYTLDRIENEQFVFVEKGNEENQIKLDQELVSFEIVEGDIVEITIEDEIYTFTKLETEKAIRKDDVQALIDKLKSGK